MNITIKYFFFAAIATVANIISQDLTIRLYDMQFSIALSVIVGTFVGLVVKYVLDKKYIFKYQIYSAAHDTKTFAMYTVMGLITTIIFWGFEFSFDFVFQTKTMRYTGGIIGLTIGYYLKYQLDKKYVFK